MSDQPGLPLTTGEGNTALLATAVRALGGSMTQREIHAVKDALAERDALREQLDAARQALKAICESTDSGPWIVEYRAAGGGYEGLQAIARAALGVEGPAG